MTVKFLPTKKSAREALQYVLSKYDSEKKLREEMPVLLSGDVELVSALCDVLPFTHPYLSGSWSFLNYVSVLTEHAVCNRIVECLAPGLETRLAPVFVRHVSLVKPHFSTAIPRISSLKPHLHFIVARVDLLTRKAITLYWENTDVHLFRACSGVLAYEHGLNDPADPAFARLVPHSPRRAPRKVADAYEEIVELIDGPVGAGTLRDRRDVLMLLCNNGYQVKRVWRDGTRLSKDPDVDLVLRGGVFMRVWKPGVGSLDKRAADMRLWLDDTEERYHRNVRLYSELRDRKAARFSERYARIVDAPPIPSLLELSPPTRGHFVHNSHFRSRFPVPAEHQWPTHNPTSSSSPTINLGPTQKRQRHSLEPPVFGM